MDQIWVSSLMMLFFQLAIIPMAASSFLIVGHTRRLKPKLKNTPPVSAAAQYYHSSNPYSLPTSAFPLTNLFSSRVEPSKIDNAPIIFPARQSLPSIINKNNQNKNNENGTENDSFSLMSWNILLPNSQDNWWCHKQYSNNVPMDKRQWTHRHKLIKERILSTAADIVCIQEADGDTFHDDFRFMAVAGYDHVLHKKFRFRCATFYMRDKFVIDQVAHKDRTLVTSLRRRFTPTTETETETSKLEQHDDILHIVNCHLSGGAAPERRLRQVHDGLDQIRKWTNALERTLSQQRKGNRPSPKNIAKAERALDEYQNHAGTVVCGDFNSDGNTAVRKLLVEGCVESDWYEPQYPNLRLTSKRKEHLFGSFVDAAELAYGGNVCDGDWSESNHHAHYQNTPHGRPATYVVPNLASLLLLPMSDGEGSPPRTEFGMQVARGFADTLNLKDWCQSELDRAFDLADHDGNGLIDLDEGLTLLESVYVATYGQQIEQERNNFFRGFGAHTNHDDNGGGLTKAQFIARLKSLQQDCEGERKAFGLARGLNLNELSEADMEQAFDNLDLDGNGLLDEGEFQTLLENVYVAISEKEIQKQRSEFFVGFQKTGKGTSGTSDSGSSELTREQFTERLLALHQELEGGRKGAECAEVRTEADVHQVIERFTPLLQCALDGLFDKFSSTGVSLSQEEVNEFLIKTNEELGRGGVFRHTSAIFQNKKMESSSSSKPAELTRHDWYGVFARELAEGKWWQVVYDLEVCGFNVRSEHSSNNNQFYQGWLDYIYFQGLGCTGVQDALTEEERMRIYDDGDALPNEWHPSDHLPVSAIFSWR